jgi:hypothetical protein
MAISKYERDVRNVRAIALLYIVCGAILVAGSMVGFAVKEAPLIAIVIGMAYGGLLVLVGVHLRRFRPWTWWFAMVLSSIGLLAVPLGTIVNIIFLVVLSGASYLFTPVRRSGLTPPTSPS